MEFHNLSYWQDKAARLSIEGRLFYQGAYRQAASGDTFTVVNPATGETLAEVARGAKRDVDAAVASAAWPR
ncbi:Gamma-glutamyl-aminobutyraldehyde dehydrogenase [Cronobacter universalis NCTC 9529]|nr:Gamma-glutamyl-aminobutyraldehyde dehydrogenase [Cronobacter universalis NCTC 9529]